MPAYISTHLQFTWNIFNSILNVSIVFTQSLWNEKRKNQYNLKAVEYQLLLCLTAFQEMFWCVVMFTKTLSSYLYTSFLRYMCRHVHRFSMFICIILLLICRTLYTPQFVCLLVVFHFLAWHCLFDFFGKCLYHVSNLAKFD